MQMSKECQRMGVLMWALVVLEKSANGEGKCFPCMCVCVSVCSWDCMRTFFVWELEVKNPLKTHHMHIVTIAIGIIMDGCESNSAITKRWKGKIKIKTLRKCTPLGNKERQLAQESKWRGLNYISLLDTIVRISKKEKITDQRHGDE